MDIRISRFFYYISYQNLFVSLEHEKNIYHTYVFDYLYFYIQSIILCQQNKKKKKKRKKHTLLQAIIGKKRNRYKVSCAWLFNNYINLVNKRMMINELEKFIGRNLFYKKNNETVEGKILLP